MRKQIGKQKKKKKIKHYNKNKQIASVEEKKRGKL